MVSVDLNRLRGNFSQGLVSSWLSRACLVRPVAEGTDIGIDLYCESVVEDKPFLHFWAQVKTISPSDVVSTPGRRIARFRFDTKHLAYWLEQPIPVYAFLVPLAGWPPVEPEEIWGVPLTRRIIEQGLPKSDSITFDATDSFEAATLDEDLRKFITNIVPIDSAIALLKRGLVAPIQELGPEGPQRFPAGIGIQYLPLVRESILNSAIFGLSLLAETPKENWPSTPAIFEAVAQLFAEISPWGLSALAMVAEASGRVQNAKDYWLRARDAVSRDPHLADRARHEQLDKIAVQLARLEASVQGDERSAG